MRLLFATDGSRGASIAEDFLLSLPLSCADEIVIVTAPTVSERESYALLGRCRWRFAARDVTTTTAMRPGNAAEVADAVALEHASELIVVGSRGLGQISGALMGSVARVLARGSLTPVLVVRARRDAPRKILLAIDGSPDARTAVDLVAHLPMPAVARISLLRLQVDACEERQEALVFEHARAVLGARIADTDLVGRGHLGEEVLRRALTGSVDLIALGAKGQTEGGGLLRASVADHVLSHAHCAVLVAKSPLRPRFVEAHVGALAASAAC
jgi:nucleotide-binding universal stress UspA family protein